jgi:hypothetical protein
VVFSNGSWFSVRKVTYGKDNVYYHNPVRRAAAAFVNDSTWDRVFAKWASKLGVSNTDSCIQSDHDYLVVFGDFSFVPAETRFWEFTGVDANGNESRPLETTLLDLSTGPTTNGPCVLADGTNALNRRPITLRIYERDANGTRKLLAEMPAARGHR